MSGLTGPQLDTTTVMDGRLLNSVKACFSGMIVLQGYRKLVTLLSKKIMSVVDFGMVMNSSVVVEPTGSSASAPVEPDFTMTGSDGGGALHGLGGAQQQQRCSNNKLLQQLAVQHLVQAVQLIQLQ